LEVLPIYNIDILPDSSEYFKNEYSICFRNRLNGPIEANSFDDEMAILSEAETLVKDLLSGSWLFIAQVNIFIWLI